MKRDFGASTEGRYIGDGRDTSAPTVIPIILLISIISPYIPRIKAFLPVAVLATPT
ncbi:MAG TPA: hypothetical protein VFZ02_05595 [Ktedonobacteraceae bacterium]